MCKSSTHRKIQFTTSEYINFIYSWLNQRFIMAMAAFLEATTVEALVSGHPRDAIKMSVTGAGRLREWFS